VPAGARVGGRLLGGFLLFFSVNIVVNDSVQQQFLYREFRLRIRKDKNRAGRDEKKTGGSI
jgi:hypothetical protein